ncbi:MAG: hypothetical protein DMF93_23040 [Acidobacteria bacterium]|nr:MAG: hypothetical protein DMF93_23040 [Acidobacteriota bacterium]
MYPGIDAICCPSDHDVEYDLIAPQTLEVVAVLAVLLGDASELQLDDVLAELRDALTGAKRVSVRPAGAALRLRATSTASRQSCARRSAYALLGCLPQCAQPHDPKE